MKFIVFIWIYVSITWYKGIKLGSGEWLHTNYIPLNIQYLVRPNAKIIKRKTAYDNAINTNYQTLPSKLGVVTPRPPRPLQSKGRRTSRSCGGGGSSDICYLRVTLAAKGWETLLWLKAIAYERS